MPHLQTGLRDWLLPFSTLSPGRVARASSWIFLALFACVGACGGDDSTTSTTRSSGGSGGTSTGSGGSGGGTSTSGGSSGTSGGTGGNGGSGTAGRSGSGGSGATGGGGSAGASTGGSGGAAGTTGTGGAGPAGSGGAGGSAGGKSGTSGSAGAGASGGAAGTTGAPDGSAGKGGSAGTPDAGPTVDASRDIATDSNDGPPNRKPCTTSFGSGLSTAFGRLDGYLSAVIIPNQATCKPDNDHVYLQISMSNATYQIAVNVFSNQGDGGVPSQVMYLEKELTSLPSGAWAEGWHTGSTVKFDYATDLGLHAADFTSTPLNTLAKAIDDRLALVNHISVFATGYGTDGADLIHRNTSGKDGAIITEPLSANPHALMFHFSNQSF